MKNSSILRLGLVAGLVALAPLLERGVEGTSQGEPDLVTPSGGPILLPHVLTEVRELVPVDGQLFLYNPGAPDPLAGGAPGRLAIDGLRIYLEGVLVEERPLALDVAGDARFGELVADIERLPREVTELHRENAFAPLDAEPLGGPEVTATMRDIESRLAVLRGEWSAGAEQPFTALDFRFELDQLFAADEAPGSQRALRLEVDWTAPGGATGTSSATRTVTRLAANLAVPTSLRRGPRLSSAPDGGQLAATAPHVHAGDLHVHSCHGEAVGACAPSGNCGAETLQVSGSFSYAQLKSQFQALGIDWYTATDHSYCIDSPSEYQTVTNECSALTDASFIAIPDTELSSDESGPQQGSDLGDAICLGATQSNHMGAHGNASWIHGGQEAFWGFCDGLFTDELDSFGANIDKIRNNGGYPMANHPAGSSFGWNSVAGLFGIEQNDMHGIEIWNGSSQSGQGGNVGMWVDWLEGGRILYGYSGSDTHDEAFAFGANHVLLEPWEPFTPKNLQRGIREGRVYMSNAHVLVHEANIGGDRIGMGSLQTLTPVQQSQIVTLEAHYNFGSDVGSVTFYAGADGVAETALHTASGLTGDGVVTWPHVAWPGKTSWSRAYSVSGSKTAYTNPIFYLPGTSGSTPFGTGLGGANFGVLTSASAPAIGSSVELDIAGMTGASSALLGMSGTQIPGGLPLAGGTLLIGLPLGFQIDVPLDGNGAGSFNFRMPYAPSLIGGQLFWQAIAGTPAAPQFLAFTNGLATPIAGLGQ